MGGNKVKINSTQTGATNEVRLFYPDFFWSLFNAKHLGVAITSVTGVIHICNHQFSETMLTQAAINLCDYTSSNIGESINPELTVFHIAVHNKQWRLHRMLLNTSQGELYCWVFHVELEARRKQVAIFKNLYRSFVDNTFELVFRTSEHDKILFSNNLFIQTFGFKNYHEALNYPAIALFETPDIYMRFKLQVQHERRLKYKQVEFKCLNGKKLTGLVNCHMLEDEKGLPVLNWTVLDISERLEYDQSLRYKNEQLAKVNNQMEKFLYSTSHDLRSPLTTIFGLVNLCKLDTKNPAILDYVNKIEASALKLDQIIKDVLSFSKTTYQRIKTERIDFETVIEKIVDAHQQQFAEHKILVEKHLVGDMPFYSDPERIDIILDNLIRNAADFFDANKTNSFVNITVRRYPDEALLEITDNGVGIGNHHLELIFNMFYKASLNSKGAGLGLYIVKEAVERLGGSVTVESEIGFGSIFRVVLPNDHKGKLVNRKLMLHRQT
jgi:PAS domain S-box-containing protein